MFQNKRKKINGKLIYKYVFSLEALKGRLKHVLKVPDD